MISYGYELVLDDKLIRDINDTVKEAPRKMRPKLAAIASRVKIEVVQQRLAIEPRKPRYPLRWKSQKQKRFVMALLRRTNNLPYQRTNELLSRYSVDYGASDQEGTLAINNRSPKARWVIGDDAQPFHLDTGWVQIAPVIAEYRPIVEQWLTDAWVDVTTKRKR